MSRKVARWLKSAKGLAAREISLGGSRFDVVAYDKKNRVFKIVECKLATRPVSIGKTFGQLASYSGTLSKRGYDFVNAASKRLARMSFNTWMEATHGGKYIRVETFVALREKALKDVEFLREIRKYLPYVGIIRYCRNGDCRKSIWIDGKRDYDLPKAKTRKIKLRKSE
ncbi:MAG TPA: hypothetical protein VGT03_09345 [Candidatus Acidoferrales bacterium]|nr:hypothetical protein [Candidatus Acidoferrales bacterium]